jgi:membrane associated rhomboid family serine protease
LGAYLVLYPRAPITVLFVFVFIQFPAWMVVGEWFLWNLLRGLGSIGLRDQGGVAFFAHIGGFIAGLLLVRPFMYGRHKAEASAWHGFRSPPQPLSPFGRPRQNRFDRQGPGRWDPWN